eukprot:g15250.t1
MFHPGSINNAIFPDYRIPRGKSGNCRNQARKDMSGSPQGYPLQEASKNGVQAEVERLLDSGLSVNCQDSFGETALHETARYGHDDICRLLLTRRADVHISAVGNNGWQPLHIAGHYGKVDVARLLLAQGAQVNEKDGRGDTPLTLASRNKQAEMVGFLISNGADRNIAGKDGKTATQIIATLDLPEMNAALLSRPTAPPANTSPLPEGKTALAPAAAPPTSSPSTASPAAEGEYSPAVSLQFDRVTSEPISISPDGLTATQTGEQVGMAFGSTSFTQGRHSWTVRIDNCQGNYLDVGVTANRSQFAVPVSGLHAHGTAVLVQRGCGVKGSTNYSWQPFVTGMEVHVLLDMDRRILSFIVSGALLPDIITGLPQEVWPAVHIREKSWSCSIGPGPTSASRAAAMALPAYGAAARPNSNSNSNNSASPVFSEVHLPPPAPPPGPRTCEGSERFLEACAAGQLVDIKTYSDQGGNVDSVADSKGDTGLILASRAGKFPVVKFLLERGAHVNRTNDSGSSALLASAMRGHDSVVSALIERKAYVHQRTEKGDSALSLACWKNNTACAMMLLTAGADALQVDQFGDTMLLDAAKHGNQAIMSLLIAKGLRLDHQNKEGKTALIRAAEFGQPDGVSLLLQHSASVDLADNQGRTALHHAVAHYETQHSSSSLSVIRHLVEKGASVNLQDRQGRSPPQTATSQAALQALGVSGARASSGQPLFSGSKTIQELAKAGKTDEVRLKLDAGVDVNSKDSYGETALHETARYGHVNTAALLLQRRADVHMQAERNNGWQPLHIAGHYGKLGVAMQLLQHGADINFKDGRGDTPLTLATRNKQDMLVRFLMEQGADPDIPGKDGKSAKEIAAALDQFVIQEILNTTTYKPMTGSSGMWTCPCQAVNENTDTCKVCHKKASPAVLEDLRRKLDLQRAEEQLRKREEELKAKTVQVEQTRQRLLDQVSEDDIPAEFLCPISYTIMMDPVTLMDGHSYERSVITEWFVRGHTTSPLTGAPLPSTVIKPNFALRASIDRFLKDKSKSHLATKPSMLRQNSMDAVQRLEQKIAAAAATPPTSSTSSDPPATAATAPAPAPAPVATSSASSFSSSTEAPSTDAARSASGASSSPQPDTQTQSRWAEVKTWDASSVAEWLLSVKIAPEYVEKFKKADIDGPTLLELDEATLEEDIGVDKRLVRKKIIGQIKALS